MNDDEMWTLLVRHSRGELPEREATRLRAWVADDPGRVELLRRVEAIAAASRRPALDPDADASWAALRERMQGDASPNVSRRAPRFSMSGATHRRGVSWRRAAVAAALLVAAAGALREATRWRRQGPAATQRIEAQRGRLSSVRLADGSRVTLAAGSALEVPESFDERRRDVFLSGQAYFEVASDSSRPFLVHARNAVTEVLGTKFGVRAYPEDAEVTVVVAEGRVAVAPEASPAPAGREPRGGRRARLAAPPAVLTRGDRARLDTSGVVRLEHDVAVSRELAWLQGRLVFAGSPLATVVREIERWYDVEIVVADSTLLAAPVSASFGAERVDRILRTLALSLDIEVEVRGDTAWLRERR